MFANRCICFFCLLFLLILSHQATFDVYRSSCRSSALFKITNRNETLTGSGNYVIKSIHSKSRPLCVRQCVRTNACSSINYKAIAESNQVLNCQLLNIRANSTGATFTGSVGWIHLEPVMQPGPRCIINPCSDGYKCVDTCTTARGYDCLDINECNDHPCLNGGTCQNTVGSYRCTCKIAFDGENCQIANIALYKPTSQSSSWEGHDYSSRAVNGLTATNFNAGYCSHTKCDSPAWWRVDLQATYRILKVKVTNRGDCCPERLADFKVYVSRSSGSLTESLCNQFYGSPGSGATVTVTCSTLVYGNYVIILIQGAQVLTLCQVYVFGL